MNPFTSGWVFLFGVFAVAALIDFGSDASWGPSGLDPNLSLVSGYACLAQSLWRRLMTPQGTFAWDPEYGPDLRQLVNETIGPGTLGAWQRAVEAQCELDERVTSASCVITQRSQISLRVSIFLVTANGPFTLVLGVEDVTVQILSIAA